jgi:alanine racemase
VLIKGQRRFGMERFAATLRKQPHPTWAEVNLGAMRRNLQKFRAKLSPSTKTMAMVKADAYGTGILEVARWLENGHIDYLGVAFSQEALLLRAQGIVAPIMVMNAEPTQFKALAQADCEVELFSMDQLLPYLQDPASDTVLKIHLKVDTGMHRLGFAPAALPAMLEELHRHKHIEVVGVFSHLSSAGNAEHDGFTQEQFDRFETARGQVRSYYPAAIGHILNTQGIARFPEREHEMVRLGIGLYGLGAYEGMEPLEEVVQWKCRISQVGEVLPGESVGYSRAFVADRAMRYATLPVGYADGLSRHLSGGKGHVIIGGQACAILGNVCMDMVMVDVSEVVVAAGDEVIIIGADQGANELAHAAGTIGYEVLTGIGPRVPRFYLKD